MTFNTEQLAQNYPQLINQLLAEEFSKTDILKIKNAFEVSLSFADGIYRAQGVPLINHLIRTASILIREKQSIDTIVVALTHAAFVVHKFDDSLRTQTLEPKQKTITDNLGTNIASMLLSYEQLHWYNIDAINKHREMIETGEDKNSALLGIRLANELEDNMDFAMHYSAAVRKKLRNNDYYEACIQLAKALKLDYIATQLGYWLKPELPITIPPDFARNKKQGYETSLNRPWQKTPLDKLKAIIKRIVRP